MNGSGEREELTAKPKNFEPIDAAAPPGFDEVYARHFEFACRSLRLLGVAPDVLEDAAQDVFGVVLRRLGEFEQHASFTTWLFAIVQRVAANYRRRQRRKQSPLTPLTDNVSPVELGPDAHADAARTARLIQEFARTLDEERRAFLVLGVLERVPVRELAESFGVPVFTAYSRVRAIRQALKQFLQSHEVEV